ncbi:Alcohol dehydrogenase [Lactiplantibacillus plantarum]|uniref:Cna B-type domain-containing protein n=1 Tax=Lactiplantibacillus plantarum TaxID=1590 RepID=UPI0007C11A7A|nr:Cna B-type domain-containing protein [Lactiplantibacillus plantarum]KZT96068.1 Alcohol dehydrogenase [Lactiplantibacillus plantarum]
MSNKSRHRRLLFMMGLVLFSLLGSIWISSNNGMTVYADSKTNITQNGTGSGTVINQQEEPQISTVNSNTTDNTSSSDDQTSQKQVTNTEAQPRAPAEQNNTSMDRAMSSSMLSERPNSVNNSSNSVGSVNNSSNSVGHDVSSNITSLTASPESINDGGKTTVRVNFDEHAQKIASGDTITVNWNNSGTVYGQGYQKNIDLNIRGVNVGTLSVTTNKAVFTFNSNINDMENVTGWGEFDLEGRNLANTSDENTGSFSIYSGGQQTYVSVKKGKTGSKSPFYYKTGDMLPSDTDHVRWFLNINNEKGYVSDRIYIKDQIQPGQTLDKGSFDITIDGYRPNHFYGSNAIENFESAYPGSSITINVSTGDITVVIPQDQAQLNKFSILYRTSVDDYNQPTFENHSQAWYTENNQPAVEGKEFDYSVSNVNANGGVDGKNQTKVSVIKEWDDNNNSARLRPDSIKVQLYANGLLTGKAVTLNSANNWQYTWSGLVKNAKGSRIAYTVKEVSIPNGYRGITTVNGNDIVIKNVYNQTINISGTKTWKDNNNQDGIRPSSITVNLLANGRQVASKTVSASDNWQYSFDNLAAYANGRKITYTVTENAVAGYTSAVDGYNVTNNHTPATVKVSGTKTWKDNNNQDGIRPSSITVNLLANGRQVASKTVSASDNWQYSFDNLAAYANGRKITYTVTENAVAGYTSAVDGYNVTNNHTPATVKVSGTKTWKDNNNQDGIRPSSITVNLLANGRQVASKTVSASDNWQYSFDNLAAYANGRKITYTVTENAVAGYTSTVDGYNITNTHNPTTPKKPQVPNNPTTPKEPQVPNNGNKVTPKAYTQGKTYEKTGKLPQTGNESSMGMMLIGLVTLLLSLGLVVISRFTI